MVDELYRFRHTFVSILLCRPFYLHESRKEVSIDKIRDQSCLIPSRDDSDGSSHGFLSKLDYDCQYTLRFVTYELYILVLLSLMT